MSDSNSDSKLNNPGEGVGMSREETQQLFQEATVGIMEHMQSMMDQVLEQFKGTDGVTTRRGSRSNFPNDEEDVQSEHSYRDMSFTGNGRRQTITPQDQSAIDFVWGGRTLANDPQAVSIMKELGEPREAMYKDNKEARKQVEKPDKYDPKGAMTMIEYLNYFDKRMAKRGVEPNDRDFESYMPHHITKQLDTWEKVATKQGKRVTYNAIRLWLAFTYTQRNSEVSLVSQFFDMTWDGKDTITGFVISHENKAQEAGVGNFTEVQAQAVLHRSFGDEEVRKVFVEQYEQAKTRYASQRINVDGITDEVAKFYFIAKDVAKKMDCMKVKKGHNGVKVRAANMSVQCFNCQQFGHYADKCPQPAKKPGNNGIGRGQYNGRGRAYGQHDNHSKGGSHLSNNVQQQQGMYKGPYRDIKGKYVPNYNGNTQGEGNRSIKGQGLTQVVNNRRHHQTIGSSPPWVHDLLSKVEKLTEQVEGSKTDNGGNEEDQECKVKSRKITILENITAKAEVEQNSIGIKGVTVDRNGIPSGGSLYVPVKLSYPGTKGREGRYQGRAFLDPGCTHTTISDEVARDMGMKVIPYEATCESLSKDDILSLKVVGYVTISMEIDDKRVFRDRRIYVVRGCTEDVVIGLDIVIEKLVVPRYEELILYVGGKEPRRPVRMILEGEGGYEVHNRHTTLLFPGEDVVIPVEAVRSKQEGGKGCVLEVGARGYTSTPDNLQIIDSVCMSDHPQVQVRNEGDSVIRIRRHGLKLSATPKGLRVIDLPICRKMGLNDSTKGIHIDTTRPKGFPIDMWDCLTASEKQEARINLQPFTPEAIIKFIESVDVNQELTQSENRRLKAVLLANADRAAAPGEREPPFIDGIVETINIPDPQPKQMGYQKFSPIEKIYLRAQQERLFNSNRIQRSNSAWSARIVLVPKKLPKVIDYSKFQGAWWENKQLVEEVAGWFRFCTDLRLVNAQMTPTAYPLRDMTEALETLALSKYFADMDVADAFFTVQLDEASRPCTAFRLPSGLWEWKVLPQGSKTSAGVWARVVDKTFANMPDKELVCYQDDLRAHGPSITSLINTLWNVFSCMRAVDMLYKPSKSRFGYESTYFLGHTVTEGHRRPNAAKIAAIQDIATPRTQTNIRSFINMAGFYRKFVKGFAQIAAPLHHLTQGSFPSDIASEWKEDIHGKAFQEIKDRLCDNPVLAAPRLDQPFEVATDWCRNGRGIGAVLQQKGADGEVHPIEYWSKKGSDTERRFSSNEGELWGVFEAVRHFRHYLYNGQQNKVITDHKALKTILTQADPHHKLWRWLRYLQQFDLVFEHRDGTKHAHADGLSRLPRVDDSVDWEDEEYRDSLIATYQSPTVTVRRVLTRSDARKEIEAHSQDNDNDQEDMDTDDEDVEFQEGGRSSTDKETIWDEYTLVREEVEANQDLEGERFRDEETNRLYEVTVVDYDEQCGTVVAYRRPIDDKPLEEEDLDPYYIPYVRERVEVYKQTESDMRGTVNNDWTSESLRAKQQEDKWVKRVLQELPAQGGPVNGVVGGRPVRITEDNIVQVQIQSLDRRWLVYLPEEIRKDITTLYHEQCGHAGELRLRKTLLRRYWWKGMSKVVKEVVKGCRKCQLRKKLPRPPVPVSRMESVYKPFQRVHIDIITHLPTTAKGNKNMITAECALTKWPECRAVKEATAEATAEFVVEDIICRHGVPETITTDQGKQFESRLFKQMIKLLGARKMRTTPYHPQSDGAVERMHKIMHDIMSHLVNKVHSDWDTVMPYIKMTLRATISSATGFSPFMMNRGREMVIPADNVIEGIIKSEMVQEKGEKVDERVDKIVTEVKRAWKLAAESLSKRDDKYAKAPTPRKWSFQEFEVGEWVFVIKPYKHPKVRNKRGKLVERKGTKKYAYRWEGPYRIVKKLSPVVYVIRQGEKDRVWHALNMKPE